MSELDDYCKWWGSLSFGRQYHILLDWFPHRIKMDTDVDKFFYDLPDDTKLFICRKEV